ncbi:hypothetical protein [uncultured Draconibacterium sp.]|uniref:hypothetical protein n=1 Tax=uncultured Draconibacterium sp. TaxID=1573823 RepID=UPI0029C979B9|nr:hypothetical protein [uncultured Draconibacterium sp.]
MIKTIKHIGSFLLILAGAIILSHAFIPHHLHNGEAVIETSECHCFYHHHETSAQTASCTHDHSESESTDCALHNLLVLPGKQIRADQPLILTTLQSSYCSLLITGLFNADLNINKCNWQYHIEGTIPLPTNIHTFTRGLRAPPSV